MSVKSGTCDQYLINYLQLFNSTSMNNRAETITTFNKLFHQLHGCTVFHSFHRLFHSSAGRALQRDAGTTG